MSELLKETADKLAKEYIVNHVYDYTTLNKNYSHGASASNQNFAYLLIDAAGDEVIGELKKGNPEENLKKVVKHFSQLILAFNATEFAFGLDSLRNKLKSNFTQLSHGTYLKDSVMKDIKDTLKNNENYSASREKSMERILSPNPANIPTAISTKTIDTQTSTGSLQRKSI